MSVSSLQRVIGRFKRPLKVVNICFIFVLIFSTLLTWREAVVLENAYVSSQRNSLDNIATTLDRQLQYNIDNLLFYRNTMYYALQSPISTDKSRKALASFEELRTLPFWQIRLDINRSLPLSGVSDEFVSSSRLLDRDAGTIHQELEAALEFSYIMRLTDSKNDLQRRVFYASRSGFYLSSTPPKDDPQIISRYYRLVAQPYFTAQSPENNPDRSLEWTHTFNPASANGQVITAAVPLDSQARWYGVVAMDFSIESMHQFLSDARRDADEGTILLYDKKFNLIASSANERPSVAQFTATQQADIARKVGAASRGDEGELRMDSRFVTWSKLNNFDGVLVKVHTLEEGVQGEFGRISIVIGILWVLFTLMLLASWLVIRRLVHNMLALQTKLTWRANYDTLTNLYNRGAFFDIARSTAEQCKRQSLPFCVIQMDLDFFKSINDRFGHHAGDMVLTRASAILSGALRAGDVAGRVGGEEFCIVLPGATIDDAARVAERIRARISIKELLLKPGQTAKITASFGVSSALEHQDYDFERLQSVADQRLYKAKQNGRNQVCVSDEDE
ncbi:cellulose biosynthesis regulator diguanylate cyclase DgcQ [Dryocola clanedunensis]